MSVKCICYYSVLFLFQTSLTKIQKQENDTIVRQKEQKIEPNTVEVIHSVKLASSKSSSDSYDRETIFKVN